MNTAHLKTPKVVEQIKSLVGDDYQEYLNAARETIARDPVLNNECTPKSVGDAVVKLAAMGLKVDHLTGEAWLTPKKMKSRNGEYYTVAVAMPGIRAFERKLMETGGVATLESNYVLEQDYFKFSQGLTKTLEHTRNINPEEGKPNRVIAAWGVLRTKDGRDLMRVLTKNELPDPKEKSFMTHEQRSNYAGRRAVMREAINTLLHDPELVKNKEALEQFSELHSMEKDGYEQGEAVTVSDPVKQLQPNIGGESHSEPEPKPELQEPTQQESPVADAPEPEQEAASFTLRTGSKTRNFSSADELNYAKQVFAVMDERFVVMDNTGTDITETVASKIAEGPILTGMSKGMEPELFLDRLLGSIAKNQGFTVHKQEPEAVGSKIMEEARREGLKSIGRNEQETGTRKGGVR